MSRVRLRRQWLTGRIWIDLVDLVGALRAAKYEAVALHLEKLQADYERKELNG